MCMGVCRTLGPKAVEQLKAMLISWRMLDGLKEMKPTPLFKLDSGDNSLDPSCYAY